MNIKWGNKPQKHDYPNAASDLSLTMSTQSVQQTVAALKEAPMTEYAAKDIFCTSGLSLLGVSNSHVRREEQAVIIREEALSLVRDLPNGKLIIADGYHRLCAVYTFDEDAMIPCKIV